MLRRPPRSTRTDTLFPYTTLFRSSDMADGEIPWPRSGGARQTMPDHGQPVQPRWWRRLPASEPVVLETRSEEHTSELQSLMRISYAVFCLKKNIITFRHLTHPTDVCSVYIAQQLRNQPHRVK